MCNVCNESSNKKHFQTNQYNLCKKCYDNLKKEHEEYKKHVKPYLSFVCYIKMVLIASKIKIV
jgi:hypothetical protein